MGYFVDTNTITNFELFSCKLLNMEHCTMNLILIVITTTISSHKLAFNVIQVLQ